MRITEAVGANVAYPLGSCWKRSFSAAHRKYRMIAFPVWRRACCARSLTPLRPLASMTIRGRVRKKLWGSSICFDAATIICLFETERETVRRRLDTSPKLAASSIRQSLSNRFFNILQIVRFPGLRSCYTRTASQALIVGGPSHHLVPPTRGCIAAAGR